MRGTQFGETYDELSARRAVFESSFPLDEARAFGISGDRTQHVLYRIQNGELNFRHPPSVVVIVVGTNNLGRDQDSFEDTFMGIRAVVLEVLQRLPGTRVLLPGVRPRGPAMGAPPAVPPAPGETDFYTFQSATDNGGATVGAGNQNGDQARAFALPGGAKYGQPGQHSHQIRNINARLEALATGSGGVVAYVDCQKCFLTPCGRGIDPEKMRDVLHPTAAGMRAWFTVLKPAVEALRSAPAPRDSWYGGAGVLSSASNGTLESIEPGVRLALSRLIGWSPHALCVTDMRKPDAPIIFANDNFFVQTGYPPEEVLMRNCRFLQGAGTDKAAVAKMRVCIEKGEEYAGRIVNYHKSGK